MTTATTAPVAANPSKALHVGLWIAQGFLAFAFLGSGFMKALAPMADLATKMSWVTAAGEPLVRFIGTSEVLGAIGLILPSLLRIQPKLTALAGAALALVMVLAAGTHAAYGEYGVIGVNVVQPFWTKAQRRSLRSPAFGRVSMRAITSPPGSGAPRRRAARPCRHRSPGPSRPRCR